MSLFSSDTTLRPRYWRYFRDYGPEWDSDKKEFRFDSPYTIYSGVNKWPEYKVYPTGAGKKICAKCIKPLFSFEAYERNGIYYCFKDYHDTFSPKCTACLEPITDTAVMRKVLGRPFHANHVACTECGIRLFDNYKFKDGRLYCDVDYHRFYSKVCEGCNKPIKQIPLYANGKAWHRGACFKCDWCFRTLDETNWMSHLGKIYCKYDWARLYSTRCRGCGGSLQMSKSNYACGGYYHPGCFTCTDCYKLLTESNYKELNLNPYCREHYHIRTCRECQDTKSPKRSLSAALHSLRSTRSRSASPAPATFISRPKSSLA